MGLIISRQIRSWFGERPVKICMVGLDAAGKTTVLMKLHLGETVTTIPTIGFNVEKVSYKNLSMTIWDVGGQGRLRPLWHYYYDGVDALLFVVDSADRERFDSAASELANCVSQPQLDGVPVLVYANKQDLPAAATVDELTDRLGLKKLGNRPWFVQGCCATQGSGLVEGLDWLSNQVKGRK